MSYGHYYSNSFYPVTCEDKTLIDKQEYRAKKWQFKTLVSSSKLKELINNGYTFFEIAEELEITEEVLMNAFTYYKENNLLQINI